MTEITSDQYRQRELPELRLDAFREHQRINELKKICIRQISEIQDILGDDYNLLADFYAELSADIYDGLQDATVNENHQGAHSDNPIVFQYISDALNQYHNDFKTVEQTTPRELTAWDFRNEVLSKTAAYSKLWHIQENIYGCPTGTEGVLDGRSDQGERFVAFLQDHARACGHSS